MSLKLHSRFKLHLRNNINERPNIAEEIPPLPKGKSAVDALADILRYLFTCSSDYIQDTDVNGRELWLTLKDDIHFVLSHPNGWEGLQQDSLREAAVQAGLIPRDHSGYSRLSFVTEGEASLHFAVQNGLPSGVIEVCFSNRPSLRSALSDKYRGRRVSSSWMQVVAQSISVLTNGIHKKRGTAKFVFLNVRGFSFPVLLSNALDSRSLSWLNFRHR